MKTLTRLLLTAALAVVVGAPHARAADIVETAVSNDDFQTLTTALKKAKLVSALQGDGPFTVFAPTDDAFAKLPAGTIDDLLRPRNRGQLQSILTYHVVPGRLTAQNVLGSRQLTTLNGQRLDVSTQGNAVTVDGARIVATDIVCDNGIIHVIDSVMLPSTEDIVATATSAGQFATLLAAAEAAGLAELLQSDGPFTVLAPTDEAFAKLPRGTVQALLEPSRRDDLANILKYHVISGRVFSEQAITAGSAETAADATVRFGIRNGRLFANDATVIANDIDASNGVIHAIDTVLMPPQPVVPQGRLIVGIFAERPGAALAAQLGLDRDEALLVTGLVEGGNAEAAGLQAFDVITKINGRDATNNNLTRAKEKAGFGGTVELDIIRRGKHRTIEVTVGAEEH